MRKKNSVDYLLVNIAGAIKKETRYGIYEIEAQKASMLAVESIHSKLVGDSNKRAGLNFRGFG